MALGTGRVGWFTAINGLWAALLWGAVAQTQPGKLNPTDEKYLKERLSIVLGNNELEARAVAAGDLLKKGWPQARQALMDVLKTGKDTDAQRAVVKALDNSRPLPENFIDAMIALLGSPKQELVDQIVEVLGRAKDGVIQKVGRLAADPNSPIPARLAAIRVLGRLPQRRAVTVLIKLLPSETSPQVLQQVYEVLEGRLRWFANIPGQRSAEAWARWDRENPYTKREEWQAANLKALDARNRRLSEQNKQLIEMVRGLMEQTYRAAADPEKDKLLLGWLRPTSQEAVRAKALDLIHSRIRKDPAGAKPSAALLARLIEMISDESEAVREEVAWVLKELGNRQAVAPLLKRLAVESAVRPRAAIVNALGYLGDKSALDRMIKLLKPVPNAPAEPPAVRAEAAGAIRHLAAGLAPEQRKVAAAALVQAYRTVKSSQVELRESIVSAMATPELVNGEMFDLFRQAAGEGGQQASGLREAAARGLGLLKDAKADRILRGLLRDGSRKVRQAAVEALGNASTMADVSALAGLLDPKTEQVDSVRQAAWKSILSICARVSLKDGLSFAAGYLPKKPDDKRRAGMFVDLMLVLESRFAGAKLPADQRARHEEALADALVMLGQPVQAATYFKKAVDARSEAGKPLEGLDTKYVSALLAGDNRFEDATRFAASAVKGNPGAKRAPLLAGLFLRRVESLRTDAKTKPKAVTLLEAIAKNVPDQFGPEWKAKFDLVRKALQAPAASKPAKPKK